MSSLSHKILMKGIRSGVTSSNPYESMKIAQRLIHSCEHRGVDRTTQDVGEYLLAHTSDASLAY